MRGAKDYLDKQGRTDDPSLALFREHLEDAKVAERVGEFWVSPSSSVLTTRNARECPSVAWRETSHDWVCRFDKLEPTGAFPGAGAFEKVQACLVRIKFWGQPDSFVQHRLPIVVPRIGSNVERLCVDHLHTMSLGV